jgi:hypothetical protein
MHSLTFVLVFCFRNYIYLVGPTSTAHRKRQQRSSFTEDQRCFLTLPFIYSLLRNVFLSTLRDWGGKGTLKIRALQGSGTMWLPALRESRPLARMTLALVWSLIHIVAHCFGIAPAEDQVRNQFCYFTMPHHSARQETYIMGTPKISNVKQLFLDCMSLLFKHFLYYSNFVILAYAFQSYKPFSLSLSRRHNMRFVLKATCY